MALDIHHAVKTLRENPKLRRFAIPAYRKLTSMMVFGRGPRVFVNSVPKAGTHLLTTLLRHIPGMINSGQHYVLDDFRTALDKPPVWGDIPDVDWNRVEATLAALNKGQFMTGHCPAEPDLLSILEKFQYKTLFILRDPRDVVVSSALYISRLNRHVMHEAYDELFKSDEERIMATITGFPPNGKRRGAESIGSKLSRYAPWLDAPSVHACRFESLIGPAGGGDAERQLEEVDGVMRHIGRDSGRDQLEALANKVWSQSSPTFRRGSIGDWRNHFTEAHRDAFKETAGEHLIALGYERNLDW
jgi:hypothetical protein